MTKQIGNKKKLLFGAVCATFTRLVAGAGGQALGGEQQNKTVHDPRDIYLGMEAISGVEGMPYEFMIPEEQYVGTRSDSRDIYLSNEAIRGTVAALRNMGGRWGGALTAGAFLKAFVGDVPWAHIDIAGVAWGDRDRGYVKKGSTGYAVRLLANYVGV